MTNLKDIINNFKKVKVLVIGDVMLDRYYYGKVTRISPEAPVPVVNVTDTSATVGGAANVAVNVAGLGAEPFLIGIIGNDAEGKIFKRALEDRQVSSQNLIAVKSRQTTVKTRIVAHQQHIVRLDHENTALIDENLENKLWHQIEKKIPEVDVVIISDYAKGMLTPNLLLKLIETASQSKIQILVDPKGKNYLVYKNATILTPNRREAAEACNFEEDMEDLVSLAGSTLMSGLNLEALLITQGENGMSLFQKNKKEKHFSAVSRDVYDVTGAGDTVISTLAVAIGAGADLENAANLANLAAGLVIEHFGTTAISREDLSKAF